MQARGTGVRTEPVSRPNPFDLLATAVVLLDGCGKVAFMNGAAENLLGVSAVQFEGQSLALLVLPKLAWALKLHKISFGFVQQNFMQSAISQIGNFRLNLLPNLQGQMFGTG